jgi:hypothetical protein
MVHLLARVGEVFPLPNTRRSVQLEVTKISPDK